MLRGGELLKVTEVPFDVCFPLAELDRGVCTEVTIHGAAQSITRFAQTVSHASTLRRVVSVG